MYTIELTELELTNIIRALENRMRKKQKRAENWDRKKNDGLIVPSEVADAFITIDNNTAGEIKNLIERLETIGMFGNIANKISEILSVNGNELNTKK